MSNNDDNDDNKNNNGDEEDKAMQAFYNQEAAQQYSSTMPDEIKKMEPDLNCLLQLLQQQKEEKEQDDAGEIIDICCGTGDMLFWLSQHLTSSSSSFTFRGMDISHAMLKLAQEAQKQPNNDNVPVIFEQANMMKDLQSRVTSSSVALVLCNFSIHHVSQYKPLLIQIHRILKESRGLLYLSFWEGTGLMDEGNDDSSPITYFHDLETMRRELENTFHFDILHQRTANEEIYPGYSLKSAYIIAQKKD